MPKQPKYDPQAERERLNSPVRMDGAGEDRVVQEMLSDNFVKAKDTEAAYIAKALAELLTGQQMTTDQINKLMSRFERIERAQEAWENDKQKFLDDIDARSRALLTNDPHKKDKYAAEFMSAAKEAREQAVAQESMSRIMFHQQMESEPKETITSSGIMEIYREGESLIPRVMPEVISIKDRKWVLMPGVPTEVPHTVAVRFREIQATRASLEERKNLMKDGRNESRMVSAEWQKINQKYKTGGDTMPTA